MARAPDRFKGIRHMAAWDASSELGQSPQPVHANLLEDGRFREGFAQLAPLGLSFDAWVYHPQLHQVNALADAFPETTIVLNHMGGRAAIGPYALRREEVFTEWRAQIEESARRPNVILKIGGIGMRLGGFDFHERPIPPSSADLTLAWRPAFEVCLAAFGPRRCMLESNFPVDKTSCSYRVVWNTFKRLSADYSESERRDLFARTAVRTYRLPPSLAEPAIKDERHF
jgi:L-fuconolactonase